MALEIRKEDIRPEFKIIEDVKDEPTLELAQDFVGGYVEGISFPNGDYLIINVWELDYKLKQDEKWRKGYRK
jgi:hypothetical protein